MNDITGTLAAHTPLEILTEARNIIANPENWARDVYCDDNGALCSLGALAKASGLDPMDFGACEYFTFSKPEAVKLLASEMGGGIADFNDDHSHEEVLAAFHAYPVNAHSR